MSDTDTITHRVTSAKPATAPMKLRTLKKGVYVESDGRRVCWTGEVFAYGARDSTGSWYYQCLTLNSRPESTRLVLRPMLAALLRHLRKAGTAPTYRTVRAYAH